jgi:3-dehydroquinate synthase
MVGTFSLPQAVFIETSFLQTLPQRELLSGFAEMIKHGLIADATYYQELKDSDYTNVSAQAIYHSVKIKNEVVLADPFEKGLRKTLNYGHTIGHAVEGYALVNDKSPLTHGEAIAIGMICEAYLSAKYCNLSQDELTEIASYILSLYPKYEIKPKSFDDLMLLMQSDKKNEDGFIMFSLLDQIGKCTFNCKVTKEDIFDSLTYYNNL